MDGLTLYQIIDEDGAPSVADRLGISKQAVFRWKRGEAGPSDDHVSLAKEIYADRLAIAATIQERYRRRAARRRRDSDGTNGART